LKILLMAGSRLMGVDENMNFIQRFYMINFSIFQVSDRYANRNTYDTNRASKLRCYSSIVRSGSYDAFENYIY